ncbi:hypothetical protein KR52_11740 [Synechococcus sp. KORDI-52]|uniref:hypothetical protein n=1 Tax=Synechococcus sp. KORDI-52 TaxID=585425 RepID=UPI0004E0748D|nr:hypothetical protein [Synechococcus sp. KORDI-52]AII49804.1 hypothetical protein KR52_11740 [Synechococcus sp. KORDI-52]
MQPQLEAADNTAKNIFQLPISGFFAITIDFLTPWNIKAMIHDIQEKAIQILHKKQNRLSDDRRDYFSLHSTSTPIQIT